MQEGYFKTSWSDIRNSPGWFGKVCLMGLLLFIPVFGPIVVYGYAFGWARDIAWDVHRPMPEKIFGNEDGQLYSRGFYAWLILLIVDVIVGVVSGIAYDNGAVQLIAAVLGVFLGIAALACIMRSAIYGRLGAGFQLGRVWNMIRHDSNGLLRILGMVLLVGLIAGVAWTVVFSIVFVLLIMAGIGVVGAGYNWDALSYGLMYGGAGAEDQFLSLLGMLAPVIGIAIVVMLVLFYALMVFSAFVTLLEARAMGYWTRQFDVAHWGGQDDLMPFEVQDASAKAAAAQYVAAQQAQQYQAQQQHQQQAPQQYQQGVQDPSAQQYQQPMQTQNPPQGNQQPAAQPTPHQQPVQAQTPPVAQDPFAAPQGYTQVAQQSPSVPNQSPSAQQADLGQVPHDQAPPQQTAPVQPSDENAAEAIDDASVTSPVADAETASDPDNASAPNAPEGAKE